MDPLLSDALYLTQLYKRVVHCLVSRGVKTALPPSGYPGGEAGAAAPPLTLTSFFLSVDHRFRDLGMGMRAEEVLSTITPIFSGMGAATTTSAGSRRGRGGGAGSDPVMRDMELLRELLPVETLSAFPTPSDVEAGRLAVSPGEVLFCLLKLVPQQALLIDNIVRQVRRRVIQLPHRPPVEEMCFRCLAEGSERVIAARVVAEFLVRDCGLTVSHALLLVDYCAIPGCVCDEKGRISGSGDEDGRMPDIALLCAGLDAELVYRLCFEAGPLHDYVAYPLLASQFAEAAVDPYGASTFSHCSGSHFVISVIDHLIAKSRDEKPASFTAALLSLQQFRELCWWLGCAEHVADPLFDFIGSSASLPTRSVRVSDVMTTFTNFFPCGGESLREMCRAAVVQTIRQRHDSLSFVQLFYSLAPYGADPIPISAYVKALRHSMSGTTETSIRSHTSGLADADLERLRVFGADRVSLLRCLTSPVPGSRAMLIEKVTQQLLALNDEQCCSPSEKANRFLLGYGSSGAPREEFTSFTTSSILLKSFQPEKIEGVIPQREAGRWKEALRQFVKELGGLSSEGEAEDCGLSITGAELSFFFYLLSAGVEDDPNFTLLLWQGFGMADGSCGRRG